MPFYNTFFLDENLRISEFEHERKCRGYPVGSSFHGYWLSIEGRPLYRLYPSSSYEIIKFRKGRETFCSCYNNSRLSPCFVARKFRFLFLCICIYIYMIYMYIYDDYIQLDRFLFRVDSTRLNFSFGKR